MTDTTVCDTNKNCKNCENCEHCENCEESYMSITCKDCIRVRHTAESNNCGCVDYSSKCSYTDDSSYCIKCVDCCDCYYCLNCKNCEDCEDCANCEFCVNCKGLTNKKYMIGDK